MVFLAAFCLAGPAMSVVFARFFPLIAQMIVLQRGLSKLLTRRILSMRRMRCRWCIVKAVGLGLGFADCVGPRRTASLSTLVLSGPALLGRCNLHMRGSRVRCGPHAAGIEAAILAQLCVLLAAALAETDFFVHRSGRALYAI